MTWLELRDKLDWIALAGSIAVPLANGVQAWRLSILKHDKRMKGVVFHRSKLWPLTLLGVVLVLAPLAYFYHDAWPVLSFYFCAVVFGIMLMDTTRELRFMNSRLVEAGIE